MEHLGFLFFSLHFFFIFGLKKWSMGLRSMPIFYSGRALVFVHGLGFGSKFIPSTLTPNLTILYCIENIKWSTKFHQFNQPMPIIFFFFFFTSIKTLECSHVLVWLLVFYFCFRLNSHVVLVHLINIPATCDQIRLKRVWKVYFQVSRDLALSRYSPFHLFN